MKVLDEKHHLMQINLGPQPALTLQLVPGLSILQQREVTRNVLQKDLLYRGDTLVSVSPQTGLYRRVVINESTPNRPWHELISGCRIRSWESVGCVTAPCIILLAASSWAASGFWKERKSRWQRSTGKSSTSKYVFRKRRKPSSFMHCRSK